MINKNTLGYKIVYHLTSSLIYSIFAACVIFATALLVKGLFLFLKMLF